MIDNKISIYIKTIRYVRIASSIRKRKLSSVGVEVGGGRWGIAQACNCHSILNAIASLIEAQRPDLVMLLIEQELDPEN